MDAQELVSLMDLEWRLSVAQTINHGDVVCLDYLVENKTRILPRLMLKYQKIGGEPDYIVAEFVRAVHQRHESGLSLS